VFAGPVSVQYSSAAIMVLPCTGETAIWVPRGNTGGSNVSPFRSLPVPVDLQRQIDAARRCTAR
jgi:Protein of unknown function (DUF3703)